MRALSEAFPVGLQSFSPIRRKLWEPRARTCAARLDRYSPRAAPVRAVTFRILAVEFPGWAGSASAPPEPLGAPGLAAKVPGSPELSPRQSPGGRRAARAALGAARAERIRGRVAALSRPRPLRGLYWSRCSRLGGRISRAGLAGRRTRPGGHPPSGARFPLWDRDRPARSGGGAASRATILGRQPIDRSVGAVAAFAVLPRRSCGFVGIGVGLRLGCRRAEIAISPVFLGVFRRFFDGPACGERNNRSAARLQGLLHEQKSFSNGDCSGAGESMERKVQIFGLRGNYAESDAPPWSSGHGQDARAFFRGLLG